MRLGCIGDDFTGSSDLANTLANRAERGLRTVQYSGVPSEPAAPDVEAGIVALKSRTIPVADAVSQSLAALEWLRAQGCQQIFFKYCSTFDSTPEGNIGPVIDALMEVLATDRTIVCPAFPATGRSLYQGHLFVGDRLLSESGMENHPLTPMTDPDIRRWLAPQTKSKVGHVPAQTVVAGAEALRAGIGGEVAAGRPIIVVDAIRDEDLLIIGEAVRGMPLITGGSGIALGLPANFRDASDDAAASDDWTGDDGPAVLLSGSCSNMTRAQVAAHKASGAAREIDPDAIMAGTLDVDALAGWALAQSGPALLYSSAEPDVVRVAQAKHGSALAGAIEETFAALARSLVANGVRRLVVAGGETSGAVVEGLSLTTLEIGPEIAAGVPALKATGQPLWLTLKSGNFGAETFFADAIRVLGGEA